MAAAIDESSCGGGKLIRIVCFLIADGHHRVRLGVKLQVYGAVYVGRLRNPNVALTFGPGSLRCFYSSISNAVLNFSGSHLE